MCGISGLISPSGFDLNELKAMTDLVRHRGPDGEGYVAFSEGGPVIIAGGPDTPIEVWNHNSVYQPTQHATLVNEIFTVGFGHRRLSILDLTACGHQPMCDPGNRYWITYNGEVYNHHELRRELSGLGYRFRSTSDTEVILAAYSQWGTACLDRFRGMWAFAIYDAHTNEIFLARDRFGIKPLYYWISPGGTFSFASEIKQFTVLPGWNARLNPQRCYDYLIYSITDHTEETMFNGVFQIRGGHYLKAKISQLTAGNITKISATKWYDLHHREYTGNFEEAAQEFNRLFKGSVDLHLRSDVQVGTALSGGLDSSAIVCEVNNILRGNNVMGPQKTFSSCCEDEKYSEKKWVDIVAAQTKVEGNCVYPRQEEVFALMSELTWLHDEPYQSQSTFLGYNVFRLAAANGVKVLLNGQGADEYLGGYGQFTIPRYHTWIKKLDFQSMFRDIRKASNYSSINYGSVLKNMLYSFIPHSLKKLLPNRLGHYHRISSLINVVALGAEVLHPFDLIPVSRNTVPDMSKHFTFHSTLPRYLKWEDRNSMANSVEARVPFLDHKLVEFSYNLPDIYLESGGETKRVLREGLRDILPEMIRNRKDKMGFTTPEEKWVKEDNADLFRNKIKYAIENSFGIINPSALDYFDDVVSGKLPFDYTYWRLIQFGDWIKVFKIRNQIPNEEDYSIKSAQQEVESGAYNAIFISR